MSHPILFESWPPSFVRLVPEDVPPCRRSEARQACRVVARANNISWRAVRRIVVPGQTSGVIGPAQRAQQDARPGRRSTGRSLVVFVAAFRPICLARLRCICAVFCVAVMRMNYVRSGLLACVEEVLLDPAGELLGKTRRGGGPGHLLEPKQPGSDRSRDERDLSRVRG